MSLESRWNSVRSALTLTPHYSPAAKMAEERALHESKLQKMEAEMKMVFQQKVNEKEAKLKQSEEELYARHREMKEALEKQKLDLEEKKRRLESGRPLTPEGKVGFLGLSPSRARREADTPDSDSTAADQEEEPLPLSAYPLHLQRSPITFTWHAALTSNQSPIPPFYDVFPFLSPLPQSQLLLYDFDPLLPLSRPSPPSFSFCYSPFRSQLSFVPPNLGSSTPRVVSMRVGSFGA